ncbi:MAG TPA: glycosyltransferase [Candidatus Binatia bacterium]|nr:glycosyltransferase [Candidatus Binatia bacterium]
MIVGSPAFSIIIPTYDRPVELARCLASLATLVCPRRGFEVIVVDDGGSMAAADVAAPFRSALDLTVLRVAHSGAARARNVGAEHARGGYLAFTDDDCMTDVGWLLALESRAKEAPGSLIGGRTLNALPANACSALSHLVLENVYAHYNRDPDDARFFASNNLAAPTEDFRDLGGFDPAFRTAEDRDLCDRWRERGRRLVYAADAVVHHAHDLTIAGLWRQHFGYGRGAYRFHSVRGRWARFRIDRRFYRDLLLRPYARERGRRATLLVLLLVLQQAANAAGFVAEML